MLGKKKYWHSFICVFFFSLLGNSQWHGNNSSYEVFDKIRRFDLPTKQIKVSHHNGFLKEEVLYWKNQHSLLQKGYSIDKFQLKDIKDSLNPYAYLVFGDYHMDHVSVSNDSIAYNYYLKSLNVGRNSKDYRVICEALKKLLHIHFKTQQNLEAFDRYSKMYHEYAYDDFEKIYANYYHLGVLLFRAYYKNEKIDDFIRIADSSIVEANRNDWIFLSARFFQLKGVYFDIIRPNYVLTTLNYDKAVTIYSSLEFDLAKSNRRDIFHNLGASELEKGNASKAIQYLKKINLAKISNTDLKDKVLIYDKLYNAFLKIGEKDSALYYLNKKFQVSDSLGIHEKASRFADLEKKYETAEKEKQILIEQKRATANRNWLIAAGIALLFGTGIAILLQQNTTKKRKLAEQEALIDQQKVATLLKEQELMSLDAMIAGQEKERTKVANELHDDLGSLMATVKLHFDNVKVDKKDPALKTAQDLLEKAYQKIRGMAHAKNSGVMANQGLLPAVQKMAKTISGSNALEVSVEDFGLADRMENSLELTIFRIVQELVANIIKHAEASKASIQFTQHEDKLNIIIEDNGKGFEMGKVKTVTNGMGLTTIEKRIEHLEGTFTVDSVLGKGSSILIDIPV